MHERYAEDLAYIHHVGFGAHSRRAAPAVLAVLRRAGARAGTVVELGCGSGILLAKLARAGYATVGVDAAPAMLTLARRESPRSRLLLASLYDVDLPSCAAVLAVGEGLNYVAGARSAKPPLRRLIRRMASALPPGGVFLADVMERSPLLVDARSWAAGDDWATLVEVTRTGPNALRRSITTFRRVKNGYRRGHEVHYVHLFDRRELVTELELGGFDVTVCEGYGGARLAAGRIVIEARRRADGIAGARGRAR